MILFQNRETYVLGFHTYQKVRVPSAGEEVFQAWGLNPWSWESDMGYGGAGDRSQARTFPRGMLQKETFKNKY